MPIASLTKLMTAYVTLRALPLAPEVEGQAPTAEQSGPSMTVTSADVALYHHDLRTDQSCVLVAAGEVLTERQLLDGHARALGEQLRHDARASWWRAPTTPMVADMNAAASSLGMTRRQLRRRHGLRPRLGVRRRRRAAPRDVLLMANPTFAQIVRQTSVTLPVAGDGARRTRRTSAEPHVVGIKSGNTDARRRLRRDGLRRVRRRHHGAGHRRSSSTRPRNAAPRHRRRRERRGGRPRRPRARLGGRAPPQRVARDAQARADRRDRLAVEHRARRAADDRSRCRPSTGSRRPRRCSTCRGATTRSSAARSSPPSPSPVVPYRAHEPDRRGDDAHPAVTVATPTLIGCWHARRRRARTSAPASTPSRSRCRSTSKSRSLDAPSLTVRLIGEGADLPTDATNLAVQVATKVAGHDRLSISVRSEIPPTRGLGSSAAVALAAAAAAGAEDPLAVAAAADGHPENAAASYRGGLVAASILDDGVQAAPLPLDPALRVVLVIPDHELATSDARAVLPETVSRARRRLQPAAPGPAARRHGGPRRVLLARHGRPAPRALPRRRCSHRRPRSPTTSAAPARSARAGRVRDRPCSPSSRRRRRRTSPTRVAARFARPGCRDSYSRSCRTAAGSSGGDGRAPPARRHGRRGLRARRGDVHPELRGDRVPRVLGHRRRRDERLPLPARRRGPARRRARPRCAGSTAPRGWGSSRSASRWP